MKGRLGQEEINAVIEVLKEGDLSAFYRSFLGGKRVVELERLFKEYHNMDHSISFSSGTTALYSAYLACGIDKGDEVITTPLSFVSTTSMLIVLGAKPVFVDVDTKTYCFDPWKVEDAVTERTKAIVPVHLLGHPCEMDHIIEVAEKHGLYVIEDCAQALGAKYKDRLVGTMGNISCFSGQWTKNVSFGGEGGMALTNDEGLARRCRQARNHGEKYDGADFIGWNFRLTELQAAVGIEQFKKLGLFIGTQVENAEYLISHLPRGIIPPYVSPHVLHPYWIMGCQYDEGKAGMPRDEFLKAATERGLNQSRPGRTISQGYTEVLYQLPVLAPYRRECPVAESLLKTNLWIDCNRYPSTIDDMDRLIEGFEAILHG